MAGEDLRQIRDDIKGVHGKLDKMISDQNEWVRKTELRVQALELTKTKEVEQPCEFLIKHKEWHRTEETKAERIRTKWQDRYWDLFVKYFPTVAALAAVGYAAKVGSK